MSRRPAPASQDRTRYSLAVAALVATIAGSSLLVDPRAEASFDAPKRLISLIGIVAAFLIMFGFSDPRPLPQMRNLGREQRVALLCFLGAVGLGLIAAIASPRRAISLDTARMLILFSLLLPIGASQCLQGRRSQILLAVFLVVSAINGAISILQSTGVFQPLAIEAISGRVASVGLIGNEGYLALIMALAEIGSVGVGLFASSPSIRVLAWSGSILFLAALAVSRNMTGWLALLIGVIPLAWSQLKNRQRRLSAVAATLVFLLALGTLPPVRGRLRVAILEARAGNWDSLSSNRLAPWAAALEMIAERPLLGFGPGTFGAEFVVHRLQAEIQWGRRLTTPTLMSSYAQVHCDYLQVFAEMGIPAGLAAIASLGALLVGLLRTSAHAPEPVRQEAIVVLAIVLAGSTAALLWSPLQDPPLAVPLLLAAGRGWSLLGEVDPST